MIEALQYDFMRNALMAGMLVSLACGMMGPLVVVNRTVFISGGIAHAAYGGIGLALFLGLPPFLGAGFFSVLAAVFMGLFTLNNRHRADTVIGIVWSVGMALGIILIDLTPGYNVDIMSYLFGSILTVPASGLWIMLVVDCIIIGAVIVFYREILALSFDDKFAGLRGVPVTMLYFFLLIFAGLTIVMTIQVVGLILVIALLTIPTYIAERYSGSLGRMMLFSFINGMVFTVTGLWFSFTYNLTAGATIVMVASAAFIVFMLVTKAKALVSVKYRRD
ncbi:metal ABC transporter permease [Candidatus Latescibacterota bacterium]